MSRQKIKNYIRFGMHRDKTTLINSKNLFDGLCIPAHLLAYYESSINLLIDELNKGFFIDPMTYLFKQDINKYKTKNTLKASFKKLISISGGGMKKILLEEGRSFEDSDFNIDFCTELSRTTLNFQKTQSKEVSIMVEKYDLDIDVKKEPLFLVPPYFDFEDTNDNWFKVSLKLAECAIPFKESLKLYPMICTNCEAISSESKRKSIIQAYNNENFDGYLVWIEDFFQNTANTTQLRDLKKFVKGLASDGKPVTLMYGGFFGVLLNYYGLSGIVHGIFYGEDKYVQSKIGGFLPPIRYYFKEIHKFILKDKVDELKDTLQETTLLDCNCDVCKFQKKTNWQEFKDSFNEKEAQEHYLKKRNEERNEVFTKRKGEISKELRESYDKNQESFSDVDISYLHKWSMILNEE